MKLLILLHHRFELWRAPEWMAERLRQDFPKLEVERLEEYGSAADALRDAEVFIGWSLRPEQLTAAKKLRWIHSPAAAVHQLMFPELIASNVVVTNGRDVHGPVVAEHALALMFALAKRIPSAVRHQLKNEWSQTTMWNESPRPRELAEATLLIVGLGSIGRSLTAKAKALGMRVIGVREHPERGTEGCDEVVGIGAAKGAIPKADFVVLATPVTEKTERMVDREWLALMKSDTYLINVGRGTLVDDGALTDALQRNKIGGAALDVFTEEPLAADSPYWSMENCLVTPHTAAVTDKLWKRQYRLIAENLRLYLDGKRLRNVVDKAKGY